jgi:hypothetical protein
LEAARALAVCEIDSSECSVRDPGVVPTSLRDLAENAAADAQAAHRLVL